MKFLLLLFQFAILFFIFGSKKICPFSITSGPKCHPNESSALLKLKALLTTSPTRHCWAIITSPNPYTITSNWSENTNCCTWKGIVCDSVTGHVIRLDLSCGGVRGFITSKSSLFSLTHLMSLDLSWNDFNGSKMVPEFGGFKNLMILDLSSSNFIGDVPLQMSHLSKLISLQIRGEKIRFSAATFKALSQNVTSLRDLDLGGIDLYSVPSAYFSNLSSLRSLSLRDCKLRGENPDYIFRLPKLQVLYLHNNSELTTGHFPNSNNWTCPLEELELSFTEFSIGFAYLIKIRRSLTFFSLTNCLFVNYSDFSDHMPQVHIPSKITYLNLANNFLNGKIPSWIYQLPYLYYLVLRNNKFSGKISEFRSTSLETLLLGGNNLHGNVDLKALSNLKELSILDLSFNHLYFNNLINYTFPNLSSLDLCSCNISEFPNFLRSTKSLYYLNLSRNKIQGSVPKWLWDIGNDSLHHLNLSHNSLTFMEPLSWKNLQTLDLHSNLFSGPIPISSAPFLDALLVSKNQLTGEISTSVCNLTSLQVLDLSHNTLTGKIPPCLSNFCHYLSVLDLRRNRLHGSIPEAFSKENRLRNLNLNGNRLEGTLPRSLMNCSYLEVLDVGNNFLNGKFPDWIESLPQLRVLVLRSNMFHGSIENPKTQFPFKGLRIIDLSDNKFNGPLPTKLFENFEAMANAENVKMEYMGESYYQDSVMVTLKGIDIELVKIQTIFTTIDFSCNNFTGEISSLIGRLKSLKGLNFSHNMLSGTIPSALGDLTNLEGLDFSPNSLVGNIPWQLASNLYQLQKLNLSSNKLEGSIPRGPQFDTFTEDSYSGNLQLCGFPLSKSCQEDSATSKVEGGDEEESKGDVVLSQRLWSIALSSSSFFLECMIRISFSLVCPS